MSDSIAIFGRELRSRRLDKKLTQSQLARRLFRSPSDISRWETGRSSPPDRQTVLSLAKALELDTGETNRLLACAQFHPIGETGGDIANPTTLLLAGEIDSPRLGLRERRAFEDEVGRFIRMRAKYHTLRSLDVTEDPRAAEDTYNALFQELNRLTDTLKISLWTALAEVCEQQSKFQEADNWYVRAALAARWSDDLHQNGELLMRAGDALRSCSDSRAFDRYEEAQEAFETLVEPLGVIRSERKRASAQLWINGDDGEAIKLLGSIFEKIETLLTLATRDAKARILREKCNALYLAGWAYSLAGKQELGIKLRQDGLHIADELQDSYLRVLGDLLIADDYNNVSRLVEAEEHYLRALKNSEQIDAPWMRRMEQGNAMRGLGSVKTKQRQWNEARGYLDESYRISIAHGDRLRQARTLNEMGHLHEAERNYPEAFEAHWQALGIFDLVGHRYYRLTTRLYLSDIALMQDDMKTATMLLAEAKDLALAGDGEDDRDLARIEGRQAFCGWLERRGLDERARELYEKSRQSASQAQTLEEWRAMVLDQFNKLLLRGQDDEVIELVDYITELVRQEDRPEDEAFLRCVREKEAEATYRRSIRSREPLSRTRTRISSDEHAHPVTLTTSDA